MERAETIDNDHGVQLIGISAFAQSINSNGSKHDIMFFISGSRLLNLSRTLATPFQEQERRFLWDEWASNRGRLIASPPIARDAPTVCGTRAVLGIRRPKAEFGFTSRVIDSVCSHIQPKIDRP